MARRMRSGSIGGHFAAFFGHACNEFPGNHAYESGGSALYAFLLAARPNLIHIPNFICESVPQAIKKAGITMRKYALGWDFKVAYPPRFGPKEYFLVPDYFGLSEHFVRTTLRNVPPERVIVDCAQAYYAAYPASIAQIYSPRKFLPVADGGFVASGMELASEPGDDAASLLNYQYLLRRTVAPADDTRSAYLESEERMEGLSLRSMSEFTKNIIRTVDQDFIRARRRENYLILDELAGINRLRPHLGDQTPLCYPLMVRDAGKIWRALLELRIYTPRYWPGIDPQDDFERALLHETLYLPIDHRYDESTMAYLRDTVLQMHHRFSD